MALKKPSAAPVGPASPATQSPEPSPPSPTPAPAAPSTTSAPATVPAAAPTAPPAGQARDLAAMRARLAGGLNGGVNSPEGAEKLTPALLEPKTQPTADGGAEPIAPTAELGPSASTNASTAAELQTQGQLTRGQKAAATRAAKKAKAGATNAGGMPGLVASAPSTTQEAGAPAPAATDPAPSAASSAAGVDERSPLNVGIKAGCAMRSVEELTRIADALEGIWVELQRRP